MKPKREGKIEKAEDKAWREWYEKLDKKEHEKMLAQLGLDREDINDWENHKVFDGIEALGKIKSDKPDLMLLDLIMPLKNGFEVLEEIHNFLVKRDQPISEDSDLSEIQKLAQDKFGGKREVKNSWHGDFEWEPEVQVTNISYLGAG